MGVTQAPVKEHEDETSLKDLKDEFLTETSPIGTLAERLCVFDPLDRPIEGGWKRKAMLEQIEKLTAIPYQSLHFYTALSEADENMLRQISAKIEERINDALKAKCYENAVKDIAFLRSLAIIEHPLIKQLLTNNIRVVERRFNDWAGSIKRVCDQKLGCFIGRCELEKFEHGLQLFGRDLQPSISTKALRHYVTKTQTRELNTLEEANKMYKKLKNDLEGRIALHESNLRFISPHAGYSSTRPGQRLKWKAL